MSVANLRTGLAGQIGIATNALHDPTTIVTPTDFLEFESESVTDQPVVVRKQMIGNSVFARSGRVRTVDTGMANGATVHALLNTGYARLLRHIFGGYDFTWPGSTRGSATLTIDAVVTAADTMVIEGQTYTFRTALTASTTANEILIAGTVILQGSYIAAAINRGVASDGNGSGVAYGSLTPRNADVVAVDNGDGTVTVSDRQSRGVLVNSGQAQEVATTETFTSAGSVWDSATLVGGVNGTDTRNLHTYTVDPLALRELMATLQIVRPPSEAARVPWTYVGKPVSAVFAAADGDALMVTPTWDAISQTLATAIATASYPAAATFFDYTQISVTLDAVAEIVEGVSFKIGRAHV